MSTNTTPAKNDFNDSKEHYESLISLFKYCITFLGVVAVGVGYMTFSDGKEMREQMKAEREELKVNILEMKTDLKEHEAELTKQEDIIKAELKEQEDVMKNNVSDMILISREDINRTKRQAISQIGNIRTVATTEARNKINQIFKDGNFDEFVENIAKNRMEPQIKILIGKELTEAEKVKKIQSLTEAIDDLTSTNQTKANIAYTSIEANKEEKFNENQIRKIIFLIKNNKTDKTNDLINLLLVQNSKSIDAFFEEIRSDSSYDRLVENVLPFYMRPDKKQSISFYKTYLDNSGSYLQNFQYVANLAVTLNVDLAMKLLNSVALVDSAIMQVPPSMLWLYRDGFSAMGKSEFANTYFYKKIYQLSSKTDPFHHKF